MFRTLLLRSLLALSLLGLAACTDTQSPTPTAPETPPGWVMQESGTNAPLFGVAFADADTGYAVGRSTVLKTTNGGKDWMSLDAGVDGTLFEVSCHDASTAVIAGEYDFAGRLLTTHDGGATWIETYSSAGTDYQVRYLAGVAFVSRDTVVAVGDNGLIVRSTDGGDTWVEMTPGDRRRAEALDDLSFNGNIGIASGSVRNPLWTSVILVSTDAGLTWVDRTLSAFEVRAAYAIDEENMFALVTDSLLTTTDGWSTWTSLPIWGTDIDFANAQHGTIVGAGLVRTTVNGGRTWGWQEHNYATWRAVFVLDERRAWMVGLEGTIAHTLTGGE
jgi:photosystem II stability/assembly factor-like uncharacterized protein